MGLVSLSSEFIFVTYYSVISLLFSIICTNELEIAHCVLVCSSRTSIAMTKSPFMLIGLYISLAVLC